MGSHNVNIRCFLILDCLEGCCRIEGPLWQQDITSSQEEKGPERLCTTHMEEGHDLHLLVLFYQTESHRGPSRIIHATSVAIEGAAGNTCCPACVEYEQWVVLLHLNIRFFLGGFG